MARISNAVSDKVYDEVVAALLECGKKGDISWKLQAIKSAKEYGIKRVSEIFAISRVSLNKWISAFTKYGVEGLRSKTHQRGRHSILSVSEQAKVREMVEENSSITLKELELKIGKLFHKKIGKSALHNLLKKEKFSHITPRPRHYKQNKNLHEEFKKKSGRKSKKQPK
jgi:transposase